MYSIFHLACSHHLSGIQKINVSLHSFQNIEEGVVCVLNGPRFHSIVKNILLGHSNHDIKGGVVGARSYDFSVQI